MAHRIAAQLPVDANNQVIRNSGFVGTPLAITYDATISASTTVTLNAATTAIVVSAVGNTILMKWGATASTSAFDAAISVGTTVTFAVPAGQTTVQFIEAAATANLIVTEW